MKENQVYKTINYNTINYEYDSGTLQKLILPPA